MKATDRRYQYPCCHMGAVAQRSGSFFAVPFEARLNFLLKYSGSYETEELQCRLLRIQKRLGGLETKKVLPT